MTIHGIFSQTEREIAPRSFSADRSAIVRKRSDPEIFFQIDQRFFFTNRNQDRDEILFPEKSTIDLPE